jgi:hypothetical protein
MSAAAPLRHGRTIAVVLVVNLALLGLGEMLTRFFHVPDRMHGFPRRMIVATDDPDLPYYLRPDYETVARGMEVRTNHYGMRGPDVPLRPAPGVRRILALGGSTTFGEAVAEEESWPARLEEILEERTGQRTRFSTRESRGTTPRRSWLSCSNADYRFRPMSSWSVSASTMAIARLPWVRWGS